MAIKFYNQILQVLKLTQYKTSITQLPGLGFTTKRTRSKYNKTNNLGIGSKYCPLISSVHVIMIYVSLEGQLHSYLMLTLLHNELNYLMTT